MMSKDESGESHTSEGPEAALGDVNATWRRAWTRELPAMLIGHRPLLQKAMPPRAGGGGRPSTSDARADLRCYRRRAGPAGLAASVYGASAGLRTLLSIACRQADRRAPPRKIENYLGFPMGITGAELTGRATLQAQKFGAELCSATSVMGLELDTPFRWFVLTMAQQSLDVRLSCEGRRLSEAGRTGPGGLRRARRLLRGDTDRTDRLPRQRCHPRRRREFRGSGDDVPVAAHPARVAALARG